MTPDITMPQPIAIKRYIATVNQTGTAAPVPTKILLNTVGIITWTRNGTGIYTITLPEATPLEKIIIPPFGNNTNGLWMKMFTAGHYTIYTEDTTHIKLTTFGATAASPVEWATFGSDIYIEINIYH